MRAYLSIAANRAVDEYAIKGCGIPGRQLMQKAGRAVVVQMQQHGYLKYSPKIVVLAGHGNNGGDGFVIAAELLKEGIPVSIITASDTDLLTGDALFHFQKLADLDIDIQAWQDITTQRKQILQADIIVDALLGTGISGHIRAPYDTLINLSNQSQATCIAVDLPSGVTGDLGEVLEPCIQAELTVSMGFGKQSCLFEPARSHSGMVVPVDIGFPADSLDHVAGTVLYQNENTDYPKSRYTRPNHTHKYTAGKVFIIAGSQGFTGAALLASTAALRSGAGLVRLALPESLGSIAESLSMETVVDYLAETSTHGISLKALTDLRRGCEWADSIVIGPGLGRHPETIQTVKEIVAETNKPLVIDADALFALSEDPDILGQRTAPTIITPHAGEFKRLIKQGENLQPTWRDAREFATTQDVSVLLKGAPSLIAFPSGKIIMNSTGYAGMATAGSGDVLSGVIASLWAQWPDDPDILSFAMYIHGKAAEINRPQRGVLGLIASDIVDALPLALKEYGGLPH
ncbi:MAG: NAD(P)H-hydrate dehydratase [Candidatus Marinimicrobia bacterium]|nr:NAD(P)H-hydrate dehydratase [Candidatus Neomarinimicrobiota bacterium]